MISHLDTLVFHIFSCTIPVLLQAIREGVGYVKTQLSCILLYYADDMFRPLWAIFRSQKIYIEENYTEYLS